MTSLSVDYDCVPMFVMLSSVDCNLVVVVMYYFMQCRFDGLCCRTAALLYVIKMNIVLA